MKKTIFLFAIVLAGLTSCTEPRRLEPAPETIFEGRGLHVVTSFYNQRTGTISLLYGNDQALAHTGRPQEEHIAGEVFKLVTWELKGNPLWFGGNINGPVKSIETVQVTSGGNESIRTVYEMQRPDGKISENSTASSAERISFIFAQRASVFP